ncbi:MAG TPA: DUF177 domain-containing protein [Thermoanaerobaculia bacterium]|jgi:uncharacterized protein|nr:DUF177 domain-containing protein [Thermoanaerobaculia bacterium]
MPEKERIVFDDLDKYGPQHFERTFQFPTEELARIELVSIGPVSLVADARKGDLPAEYLADGTTTFTADFLCSRCVEPFPFANASEFHLRFRPRPEISEENAEVEVTPDELDVEFYTERAISLRHLANEQIQLAIPMKPLCTDRCLGLCVQCGANQNGEGCSCAETVIDTRFAALAGIREQLAKKNEQ